MRSEPPSVEYVSLPDAMYQAFADLNDERRLYGDELRALEIAVIDWLAEHIKQVGFVHSSGKVVDIGTLTVRDVNERVLRTANPDWTPAFTLPEEVWPK